MMATKRSFVRLLASLAVAVLQLSRAQSCNLIGPAVIKGKKFFDSRSGKYIALKGVNYYPRPNAGELSEGNNRDFFGEEHRDIWERDIQYFQELGINVIRIYAVNPGLDHSGFMCTLKQAGIYVIVGLAANCEKCAITGREAPACYPGALKERGQFVINVFSKYENVLAFSAGNEAQLFIQTGDGPERNAPCQKQFIRDMRAYIAGCEHLRKIPVGLAVADFYREEKALYYSCRSNASDEFENSEWYGLNVYLHCDGNAQSIDDLAGFQGLLESHRDLSMSMPVVLSEFGCPNRGFPTIHGFEGQRNWMQVEALFSQEYIEWFAGGVVFEYSAEKNRIERSNDSVYPFREYARHNFGLRYFTPAECDDFDTPCNFMPYPEFDTLASKFAAVDVSEEPKMDSYIPPDLDVKSCPSNFPALDNFAWESEHVEDLECVGPNYVFICPNTAPECLPPFARPPSTSSPPTVAPSTSPTMTLADVAMTNEPTVSPTKTPNITPVPSEAPSGTRTTAPTENEQTASPTQAPNVTPLPSEAPSGTRMPSPTLAALSPGVYSPFETPMDTPNPSEAMGKATGTQEPTPLALRPVAFQPSGLILAAKSSVDLPSSSTWLWSMVCLSSLLCLG